MKLSKEQLKLYVVTDRSWLAGSTLEDQVEQVIRNGASFIQIREKGLSFDEYVTRAESIKQVTDQYRIPFVVNDDVEVAVKVKADGVHVGQKDASVRIARERLGPDKIVGASVQTVEQARLAEEQGADYLGVGAVFSTSTKADADSVSRAILKEICQVVRIPVIAIGGIGEKNLLELAGTGIAGVAVISAIFAAENPALATQRLRRLVEELG